MSTVMTKYGTIIGVTGYDSYFDGQVNECSVGEENEIETEYGVFIPQYSAVDPQLNRVKKRRSSVSFYDNGTVKSIALEKQTKVHTPLGEFQAELVTFYKSGKLKRLFPLNGQINGFWSEEDEESLCETYAFDFSFGSFEAKIIGLQFYETGEVKSITLWPGEVVEINTPQGVISTRVGISMYKDGSLKSIEPANQTLISTAIGTLSAHDHDALGIHGDNNSLAFNKEGEVTKLTTYTHRIVVKHGNGIIMIIEPEEVVSFIDISETTILPLKLVFDEKYLTIMGSKSYRFSLKEHDFMIKNLDDYATICSNSCSACKNCST